MGWSLTKSSNTIQELEFDPFGIGQLFPTSAVDHGYTTYIRTSLILSQFVLRLLSIHLHGVYQMYPMAIKEAARCA